MKIKFTAQSKKVITLDVVPIAKEICRDFNTPDMEKTRLFRDLGTGEVHTLENLRSQFEQMRAENPDDWEGWTFTTCLREWLRCSDLAEIFSFSVRYAYEYAGKIHTGKRCIIAHCADDAVEILEELLLDDGIDDYNVLEVTRA